MRVLTVMRTLWSSPNFPDMKFSWDWIQELSGTTLTREDAAALLNAKAFETVVSADAGVLDIDILPNRPDAVSHLGVARELAALTNQRFAAPSYEWHVSEQSFTRVSVQDSEACPRYSALVVKNVKVGPSPSWLKERLEMCGLNSINNVVDVTNYVMLELGQPMHAFDAEHIDNIVVRRAKAGETLTALDAARTQYALDESMLVIADGEKAVALAGVKGGAGTGISDTTTDILLEAANFNPESVRATSRKLGLRTDASIRFSYGVDPNLTAPSLMLAAQLLAKVAGGTTDRGIIDVYPTPVTERTVILDPAYARSLLGVDIGDAQMRSILQSLGFGATGHDSSIAVTVPTRRSDVTGPEEVIEEIGRVYGFDSIPSTSPVLPIYGEHSWVREDSQVVWNEAAFMRERSAIGRIVAGAGYSEVYNYAFLSDELKNVFGLDKLYELEQPLSREYAFLRPSLLNRMVLNVRDNFRYFDTVRLFETGHRFPFGKPEGSRLAIVLASKTGSEELFYELKGVVDLLGERLGIAGLWYDDAPPFAFGTLMGWCQPGRAAEVKTEGGSALGVVGLLKKSIAEQLKVKGTIAVAEFDLSALIEHAQQDREFEPLPKYPDVVRDIAVKVSNDIKIDDILDVIDATETQGLVRDVDVFDIFVPTGKEKLKAEGDTPEYGKSVAFHIIMRSDERTLTDKDADAVVAAISAALQEKLDALVR